jgi:arylsulfatase A-like enzyme
MNQRKTNLIVVFADQWRAQATGYAGDPNARTPRLDQLAGESVNFSNATSSCPVCSPYRASLITGQYALTHGVFLNDVCLSNNPVSIAEVFRDAGYDTAYIGKWHLDGHGRSNYIHKERRHGFEFWKGLECSHDYNHSPYYFNEDQTKRYWQGYDAIAQTDEACEYLSQHAKGSPFLLFLSWGPPHAPYETAPEPYRARYKPEDVQLRPNVPDGAAEAARRDLAGYYAHIAALDDCVGKLLDTLQETGLDENTVFLFTSDHGDMLGSQGLVKKQHPYDESIRVPFLLKCPRGQGCEPRTLTAPINAPDVMPTLLSMCGLPIPETVEGLDYADYVRDGANPGDGAALITCPAPFGQVSRAAGGKEYRGVRTARYTFVRDMKGPWLFFDNERDPYQLENLSGNPTYAAVQGELDAALQRLLKERNDAFLPGEAYIEQWGYVVDETGTVPYGP